MHVADAASDVAAYGYQEKENRLFIRYKTGLTFCYISVPFRVFMDLRLADPINVFVNRSIHHVYMRMNMAHHPDLQEEVEFVEQEGWVTDIPKVPALKRSPDPHWAW